MYVDWRYRGGGTDASVTIHDSIYILNINSRKIDEQHRRSIEYLNERY